MTNIWRSTSYLYLGTDHAFWAKVRMKMEREEAETVRAKAARAATGGGQGAAQRPGSASERPNTGGGDREEAPAYSLVRDIQEEALGEKAEWLMRECRAVAEWRNRGVLTSVGNMASSGRTIMTIKRETVSHCVLTLRGTSFCATQKLLLALKLS